MENDGRGLGRGRGRRPTFDHDEAIRLYTTQEWSVARLARKYSVSDMTIYRMLAKHDIKLRWGRRNLATCRNGHARRVWGHRNQDGRWRCRRCDYGETAQHIYVVRQGVFLLGLYSTLDLAIAALPARLAWDQVDDYEWCSDTGMYVIRGMPLDPEGMLR